MLLFQHGLSTPPFAPATRMRLAQTRVGLTTADATRATAAMGSSASGSAPGTAFTEAAGDHSGRFRPNRPHVFSVRVADFQITACNVRASLFSNTIRENVFLTPSAV